MTETTQLDAAGGRAKNEVKVDMLDGTHVLCMKRDLTLLVFEGKLPMPLLQAVEMMIAMPGSTVSDRVKAIGEHGKSLVDLLREHAVEVAIRPRLSMEYTEDPNYLPAMYLNLPQLMQIWTHTAVVPRFTAADAATFRREAGGSDAAAAPSGDAVQPAPVVVAGADVITG